jgi:chloride channel 6
MRPKGSDIPSKDYDSLDYDNCYNVPYKNALKTFSKKTYLQMEVMRWVLVGFIGVFTGVVALFIDVCVRYLFRLKFSLFEKVYHATVEEGNVITAFLLLLGFNVLFAIIASAFIVIEPVAAGSGIPEIKCYLNGIKVPHVTRLTTLVSKAVGVLFSVSGGFFVGKEGPMIHSGAIVGAGLPQFRSMFFKFINLPYHFFRSDREKRDFVSSGAAAGVAAAFGAPIGGVLFSLEEGSSFWNQSLTWRTLFCSFCSTFTLNLFLSPVVGLKFGLLGTPSLVDFGVFQQSERQLWKAYHLIVFIIMGAVGGLLGALFNSINTQITIYRLKYLIRRRRVWRMVEAVLIIMCTTAAVSIAVTVLGTCVPVRNDDDRGNFDPSSGDHIYNPGDTSFRHETIGYFCPDHGDTENVLYYNDLATILFNPQETAIKQLFHQNGAFTLPTLWIVFLVYFVLACWTYGAGIPSGLFIPCLVIGATYGRFVALALTLLEHQFPILHFLTNLYPGTYALIGAASFLGGVVRMTISLTVILIESTNEIDYGLPIMLTLMVAKWVGDIFNHGLYDIHVELKKTPLLGWESPHRMEKLIAEDVMNPDLKYLYPITRVGSIVSLLRTTAHSAFLIVTPVSLDKVHQKPQTMAHHTPQLYSRRGGLLEHALSIDSDVEDAIPSPVTDDSDPEVISNPFSLSINHHHPLPSSAVASSPGVGGHHHGDQYTHVQAYPTIAEVEEVEDRGGDLVNSLTVTLPLPEHSRGRGIQPSQRRKDEQRVLVFHGIILRSQLVTLLQNKIFFSEGEGSQKQPDIDHRMLSERYPRYPSVFDVSVSEDDKRMLMDLSLFMNPSPYTISYQAPLPQVFNLFRTMGLRHLPVMQDSGIVVGIITRHDLTHERLHELRHRKKIRERATHRANRRLRRNRRKRGGYSGFSNPQDLMA